MSRDIYTPSEERHSRCHCLSWQRALEKELSPSSQRSTDTLQYPVKVLNLPMRVQEDLWVRWGFTAQRSENFSKSSPKPTSIQTPCSNSYSMLQPKRLLWLGRLGGTNFSKSSGKLQKRKKGTSYKIIIEFYERKLVFLLRGNMS